MLSAAAFAAPSGFASSRFSALMKAASASSTRARRFDAGRSGAALSAFSFTSYSRESTRPGSDAVSAEEEWRRIGTVIRDLAAKVDVPLSIDTMKATVAAKAIDAGASLVNDVSGVRDPAMVRAVAERKAGVVVMHMAGNPKTMQEHPQYADVVREVDAFLTDRIRTLEVAGVRSDAIAVDPGVGFGKTPDHNLTLL